MKKIFIALSSVVLIQLTGFAQINIKNILKPSEKINSRITKLFPAANPVTIAPDKIKMYNDFKITYNTPLENTLAAIEPIPGTNASNGKLILSCGQDVGFPIATRSIFKADGTIPDFAGDAATVYFPALDSASYGTDNQIVRLKNGSLLQMRNSNTWKAMQDKPAWGDAVILGQKGNRGSTMFWSSADNGDNWQLLSVIDFGEKALQKFGAPRAMDCKGNADVMLDSQCTDPSKNRWWFGGGDRPELYACPYTGTIYLTTRIISNTAESGQKLDNYLLFYSKDNGKTWALAKDDFPGDESLVMTSTPDGRLILFQGVGNTPKVYIGKFTGRHNSILLQAKERESSDLSLVISAGFPVYYKEYLNTKSILGPLKNIEYNFPDSLGAARINKLGVGTADIARVSESAQDSSVVYAAYQVRNDYNNQEYCIIRIAFGANSNEPVVSNVARITAEKPAGYSVMHGNFIQPNFVNVPANIKSGLCMFYWVEAPRGGPGAYNSYNIKYILLRNGHYTAPAILPTSNSQPRSIEENNKLRTGDYLRGGFFYYNNRYHFVPQWPEADGIHANIVAVDPDAIAFYLSTQQY